MIQPSNTAAIFKALFDLAASTTINGKAAFLYTKQRLIQPESIPQLPALLMEQLPDRHESGLGKHAKVLLHAHLYIFAQTPKVDDDAVPADVLNPLKDALVTALAPPAGSYPNLTLGSLVSGVWIDGDIEIDEGLADRRGIIRIPITIMATQ